MASNLADYLKRFVYTEMLLCKSQEELNQCLGKPERLRNFVQSLQDHRAQGCYCCEYEGGCLLLLGIALLGLQHYQGARSKIEEAVQCFGNRSDLWNQINGLNLLGQIYEKEGNLHLAIHSYQEALRILTRTYLALDASNYKPEPLKLKEEIEKSILRVQQLSRPLNNPRQRLGLEWLPIYGIVQATPNGPIWMDADNPEDFVETSSVIIDDETYSIYFCAARGDGLLLQKNRRYGWVKVHGDSMNAAKPVPIEENDYALFYQSENAAHNDIVVVMIADPSGAGYEYLIKRFDKQNKQMLSETTSPHAYAALALSPEDKIVGIVIAVAKPSSSEIL